MHRHFFNVHGFVHRNNILKYIQQDATLNSLFYLETALHASGGTITHHQERKQMYLIWNTSGRIKLNVSTVQINHQPDATIFFSLLS